MYVYMSSNEFECLGELVGDNYSFYFFLVTGRFGPI